MTIEEFAQTLVFIACLLLGCVVLPVGLVASTAPDSGVSGEASPEIEFVFNTGYK